MTVLPHLQAYALLQFTPSVVLKAEAVVLLDVTASLLLFGGIQVKSDEHFFTLVILGYARPLAKDISTTTVYTLDSLRLQGNQDFDSAQTAGNKEYFEFYTRKIRIPVLLISYFHGSRNMENLLAHYQKNN